MLELTINGTDYQFTFSIAFMRAMNKAHKEDAKKLWGENARANGGLAVSMMAVFMDDDIDELITILDESNKGMEPRIKKGEIEKYIEDPDTDLDELLEKVKNSLSSSNATKKEMKKVENLLEEMEKEEERDEE